MAKLAEKRAKKKIDKGMFKKKSKGIANEVSAKVVKVAKKSNFSGK